DKVLGHWVVALRGVGCNRVVDFIGLNLRKGIGIFVTDCADSFSGAEEIALAMLGDDLAAVAGGFEAVGAGGFAGAGDEVADGSVLEFDDGADFVFGFDRVGFADKSNGGDATGR